MTASSPQLSSPVRPRQPVAAGVRVGVIAALAMFLAASAVIVLDDGSLGGRARFDQDEFHLPTILQFAEQWPAPDVSDYRSATTPLYHLVLAGVRAVTGFGETGLRLVSAAMSALLVGVAGYVAGRRLPAHHALACVAPMLTSVYVFPSAAWLLPDNLALLGVAATLALALAWPSWVVNALAAGVMTLVVATRQPHIWILAPVLVGAWIGRDRGVNPGRTGLFSVLPPTRDDPLSARLRRTLWAGVSAIPAIAVLGVFVWLWGGLVPPTFGGDLVEQTGPNWGMPALSFGVLGVIGACYAGYWGPQAAREIRARRALLAAPAMGFALGLIAGLLPPTSASVPEGRFGGLWALANLVVVADRSVVIALLAAAGGAITGVVWLATSPRDRWVLTAAVAGAVASMTANAFAFHRYIEPLALVLFAFIAARVGMPARRAWIGPAALVALGAVLLLMRTSALPL